MQRGHERSPYDPETCGRGEAKKIRKGQCVVGACGNIPLLTTTTITSLKFDLVGEMEPVSKHQTKWSSCRRFSTDFVSFLRLYLQECLRFAIDVHLFDFQLIVHLTYANIRRSPNMHTRAAQASTGCVPVLFSPNEKINLIPSGYACLLFVCVKSNS